MKLIFQTLFPHLNKKRFHYLPAFCPLTYSHMVWLHERLSSQAPGPLGISLCWREAESAKSLNLIFIIILAKTRANLWPYSKHQQICCGFEPNAELLQYLNKISFSFGLSLLFLHWNILFAKAKLITIFMHNALFCFTVLLCKNTRKCWKLYQAEGFQCRNPMILSRSEASV